MFKILTRREEDIFKIIINDYIYIYILCNKKFYKILTNFIQNKQK